MSDLQLDFSLGAARNRGFHPKPADEKAPIFIVGTPADYQVMSGDVNLGTATALFTAVLRDDHGPATSWVWNFGGIEITGSNAAGVRSITLERTVTAFSDETEVYLTCTNENATTEIKTATSENVYVYWVRTYSPLNYSRQYS